MMNSLPLPYQLHAPARRLLGRVQAVGAAVVLAVTAPVSSAAPDANPSALMAACDAPAMFSTLRPAAQRREARAIWLNRHQLQWPGLDAPSGDANGPARPRYRLVGAGEGGLVALPGQAVQGADSTLELHLMPPPLAPSTDLRVHHLAAGPRLVLAAAPGPALDARLRALLRGEVMLVQEDAAGRVLHATDLQHPGALDDLYAAADDAVLGVLPPDADAAAERKPTEPNAATHFALWAPTAQRVGVCLFPDDNAAANAAAALQLDARTGVWQTALPGDLAGRFYSYLVDVWVPGQGLMRQRVADPYAISLGADSHRAWIGRLDAPALAPEGWAAHARPRALASATDLSVYELHVRDFSILDASVATAARGKYTAFAQADSAGMRHLKALARAGLTDVHLLPVFDFATVPERGCSTPVIPQAGPASLAQQAAVMAGAAGDCFNWGYDPLHFNAPEGSYASRADDGATRILEFRQMVMGLHRAGLRVGMDMVYNHLSASGQQPRSVLDRIVPGYYHRLDAAGQVEHSTCCDNSATEHRMMAKLMLDSVRLWAREYRIDSLRFDLMGHQPRAVMERMQALLRADNGREIALIGEGWNFGEVANGARFVQAAQGTLNGSGIGTFNDRLRDALRGGGAGDGPRDLALRQGWLNGLVDDPNEAVLAAQPIQPASESRPSSLARAQAAMVTADLVRLGLAGSLASYRFITHTGEPRTGAQIAYGDQPAGYASQPAETVNYVENHDNHTLWDVNAFKLPLTTTAADRARVQLLGLAVVAWSQGVAYFHGGGDLLRSKSMDGNSYNSGDWFNRLDWTYRDNGFGSGLPPPSDNLDQNLALQALMAPRLASPQLKAGPAEIAFARDAFQDLLRIRASSRLFRLTAANEVQRRLRFHNTGPLQNPALIAAELDGSGLADAGFAKLMLLINAGKTAAPLDLPEARGQRWTLHPVHAAPGAADRRAAFEAKFDRASGRFSVPARTAVVFVQP